VTDATLIDESTPFGARAAARLRTEEVAWLTTVTPSGTPQPSPIWFLWDGGTEVLIFSRDDTSRSANIAANPTVSLHFNTDDTGGDVVVFTGTARLCPGDPAATEVPAYLAKYEEGFRRLGSPPERFVQRYSLPIRVTLTRLRGFF
jgi:PPOX class probable F420-dependent enzyme